MRSTAPNVYTAINAVSRELSRRGVAKLQTNVEEQYQYRSIDEVLNRLSPILAKHKLCMLPRVLERSCVERNGDNGTFLVSVSLKVAFDLVSAQDGSTHVIEAYGEALDGGDKGTSKAMSSAFKYALLQAFCVPVLGVEDADARTYQLRVSDHLPEPVQGWTQWTADILEVVRVCQTGEALERVQNSNRALLKAISRERADLYAQIGTYIQERRRALALEPIKGASNGNGRDRTVETAISGAGVASHA
jgi:hypothetical protein